MSIKDALIADFGAANVHSAAAIVWKALREEAGVRADFAEVDHGLGLRLDLDLKLDSLNRVQVAVAIEDALGITITDDAMEAAETVADLVRATCHGCGALKGQAA